MGLMSKNCTVMLRRKNILKSMKLLKKYFTTFIRTKVQCFFLVTKKTNLNTCFMITKTFLTVFRYLLGFFAIFQGHRRCYSLVIRT